MFLKKEVGGVPFYAPFDDAKGVRAAVSTRYGGVSEGHLASLNLRVSCGDTEENVKENLQRFGKAVGFSLENTVTTKQEHTTHILRVTKKDAGIGTVLPPFSRGVDGLITNEKGLALLTYYADCVPVLLYDPVQKAAGICHSGWRGTVGKIAAKTALKMQEAFSSRPSDIRAAIGPHIGACCFEVDAPVYEAFYEVFPSENGFAEKKGEKYHIDLTEAVKKALSDVGVEKIADSGICTACHADEFFSHRKTGGKRGCFGAMIMLTEE